MKKELLRFLISLIFLFPPMLSHASTSSQMDTICLSYGNTFSLSQKAQALKDSLLQRERAVFPNDLLTFEDIKYIYTITNLDGTNKKVFVNTNVDISGTVSNAQIASFTIEYKRKVIFGNIPIQKPNNNTCDINFWTWTFLDDMARGSTGESDANVVPQSAKGVITTSNTISYSYLINKSMGSNWQPIIEESACLVTDSSITIRVDKKYAPFTQQWQAQGLNIIGSSTKDSVKLESEATSTDYLYSVIYTVSDCERSVSDTIIVGKTAPFAQISDTSFCIPMGLTLFTDSIQNTSTKLSYRWSFKDKQGQEYSLDSGTNVSLTIPANSIGEIHIQTIGACNTTTSIVSIHRSLQPDSIQLTLLDGLNSGCLFTGDTLQFNVSRETNQNLLWQKPALWQEVSHDGNQNIMRSYILKSEREDNIISDTLKVSSANCAGEIMLPIMFRKEVAVSLEGEHCVNRDSTHSYTALSGENTTEYKWFSNFEEAEILSDTNSHAWLIPSDAGKGLFVAVKTTECGRSATDSLSIYVKASKPEIDDSVWNAETACMPLGILDSIRLQVQAQNGIDGFTWILPSDWEIRSEDSVGIKAEFLAPLSMQGKAVNISVLAKNEVCGSSDTTQREISLYGANVNPNWRFGYIFYADYTEEREDCILCGMEGVDIFFSLGFIDSTVSIIEPISQDYFSNKPELDDFFCSWFDEGGYADAADMYHRDISFLEKTVNKISLEIKRIATQCQSNYTIDIPKPAGLAMAAPQGDSDIETENKQNATEYKFSSVSILEKELAVFNATLIPNPAKDKTTIRFDKMDAPLRIEILNSMGGCIYQTTAHDNESEINTSLYASGVYFVRCINTQNGTYITKKLMIR